MPSPSYSFLSYLDGIGWLGHHLACRYAIHHIGLKTLNAGDVFHLFFCFAAAHGTATTTAALLRDDTVATTHPADGRTGGGAQRAFGRSGRSGRR